MWPRGTFLVTYLSLAFPSACPALMVGDLFLLLSLLCYGLSVFLFYLPRSWLSPALRTIFSKADEPRGHVITWVEGTRIPGPSQYCPFSLIFFISFPLFLLPLPRPSPTHPLLRTDYSPIYILTSFQQFLSAGSLSTLC